MLRTEMRCTGKKIDLNKFTIPVSNFIKDFPQYAVLYNKDNGNILSINKQCMKLFDVENEKELENQSVFYLEKKKRKKNPKVVVDFAHTVENELSNTLSLGKPQMFLPCNAIVNADGYCTIFLSMRTPVFDGKKIAAVLTANTNTTKTLHTEKLYEYYKIVYKDDIKLGNKKFLEYLGLPIYEYVLATREIETLIALAKYRSNKGAARSMGISGGTIEGYLHRMKSRLHNKNLNDILLYFTTPDKRKF